MRYFAPLAAPLIATMMWLSMATLSWSGSSVDITDSNQAAELVVIQKNLDAISSAVMACIDAGQHHRGCLCQNQALVGEFNASVKALFAAHPNLGKQDLVQFPAANGMWVTQSLLALRQQANSPLSCP